METFEQLKNRLRKESIEDMKKDSITFEQADMAFIDMMENDNSEKSALAEMLIYKIGTSSSGNYGHAGRPGMVGGSRSGGSGSVNERNASFGVGIYDRDDRDIDDIEVNQQALFEDIYLRELNYKDFITGGKYDNVMRKWNREDEEGDEPDMSLMTDEQERKYVKETIKSINEDSELGIASDLTGGVNKKETINKLYNKLKNDKDFMDYVKHKIPSYEYAVKFDMETAKNEQEYLKKNSKYFINHMVKLWSATSADNNPKAIAMQIIAQKLFGDKAKLDHFLKDKSSDFQDKVGYELENKGTFMKKVLQAQYDLTQEYLKKAGVSELVVYRGHEGKKNVLKSSKSTEVNMQPLSSFSLNFMVADNFTSSERLSTEDSKPSIIASIIPAKKVFALPNTGIGCTKEFEVVVLGGKIKSTVIGHDILKTIIDSDIDSVSGVKEAISKSKVLKSIKFIKKEVINLDEELINADWTKQTWDVDIPKYGSKEFNQYLKDINMTLEDFQHLPIYYLNYNDENKKSVKIKGGAGSGNFGHSGRPGQIGGSSNASSGSLNEGRIENIVLKVDKIISKYLPDKYSIYGERPKSPPIKDVVFRVMKDEEFENIKNGERSGNFWTSDPTEYGGGAFGKYGEESDDVLVVAQHKKEWGQIYRGLIQTAEEASKAHFQSTYSRGMEDIISVYKWDKKNSLVRVFPKEVKSLFDMVYKGGAGSGSWSGQAQPRFNWTPKERLTALLKEREKRGLSGSTQSNKVDISKYPKDAKQITSEQAMAQADYNEIKSQMEKNLSEVKKDKVKLIEVKGELNDKSASNIEKNMKAELASYSNYLAGDTNNAARDYIDAFRETINKGIKDGSLKGIKAEDLNQLAIDNMQKLIHQEVESNRQQFTDHGIRHITGDIARQREIMNELNPKTTGKEELMGDMILINHDVGYSTPLIREGGERGIVMSKQHQLFSEKIAQQQKSLWNEDKIFTSDEYNKILNAIKTHDSTKIDKKDALTTSVRLSDNLSLFSKEKLPGVFKYISGGDTYLMNMGIAARKKDTAAFEKYKADLYKKIDSANISSRLKRDLKAATKEISYLTPKFSMGVLAGEISSIKKDNKSGRININIQYNDYDAKMQKLFDMGQKQTKKFLEDYGIKDYSKTEYDIGDIFHLKVDGYIGGKRITSFADIIYKGGQGSGNWEAPGQPRYNKQGFEALDENHLRKNPKEVKEITSEIKKNWEGDRKALAILALRDISMNETGAPKGMIIKDKKETVGVIAYEKTGDSMHLAMIATKRKGYGYNMMKDFISMSVKKKLGIKFFASIGAVSFYDGMGIKPSGKLIKGSGRNYAFSYKEAKAWLETEKKKYEEIEPEDGIFVNNRGLKKKEVKLFNIIYKGGPGSGWFREDGHISRNPKEIKNNLMSTSEKWAVGHESVAKSRAKSEEKKLEKFLKYGEAIKKDRGIIGYMNYGYKAINNYLNTGNPGKIEAPPEPGSKKDKKIYFDEDRVKTLISGISNLFNNAPTIPKGTILYSGISKIDSKWIDIKAGDKLSNNSFSSFTYNSEVATRFSHSIESNNQRHAVILRFVSDGKTKGIGGFNKQESEVLLNRKSSFKVSGHEIIDGKVTFKIGQNIYTAEEMKAKHKVKIHIITLKEE